MIGASAVLPGLLTGLSLIAAIGAQNAFVIRQGLTRRYVFEVALVSAALDAALIVLGVAGLGVLIANVPLLFEVIRWFGVAYLVWFGIGSLRRVFAPEVMSLTGDAAATRRTIVLSTISFSLLNPHVYLDTVVFLGSIANQFTDSKWWFALGACLASFVWFFSIAYGARSLARYVTSRKFWQVLDTVIALTMFTIAGYLAFTPLS
jgi:L-lysine exporter family protein LysE/ArgO